MSDRIDFERAIALHEPTWSVERFNEGPYRDDRTNKAYSAWLWKGTVEYERGFQAGEMHAVMCGVKPDRTPDARSTMAAQPDAVLVNARETLLQIHGACSARAFDQMTNSASQRMWSGLAGNLEAIIDAIDDAASPAAPVTQADARSTSDAAVVLCEARMSDGSPCTRTAGMNGLCGPHTAIDDEITKRLVLADRATRSTDSSAEAAQPKPSTHGDSIGERARHVGAWETPEGHVCFGSWMAVSAMVTYVVADMAHLAQPASLEADKLTTAPHTAGETRDAGDKS